MSSMTPTQSPSRYSPGLLAVLASMALYAAALFAPALSYHVIASCTPGDTGCLTGAPYPHADEGLESSSGINLLLSGIFFGPFEGVFAAYANPLLWLGWLFLLRRKNRAALFCLLPACLLSLQTFEMYWLHWPLDEGGVKRALLAHLQIGFFLWFASLLIAAAAAYYWLAQQRRSGPTASPDIPH